MFGRTWKRSVRIRQVFETHCDISENIIFISNHPKYILIWNNEQEEDDELDNDSNGEDGNDDNDGIDGDDGDHGDDKKLRWATEWQEAI